MNVRLWAYAGGDAHTPTIRQLDNFTIYDFAGGHRLIKQSLYYIQL